MMKSSPLLLPSISRLVSLYLVSLVDCVSASTQPTCFWEYLDRIDSAPNDGPCAVVNSSSVRISTGGEANVSLID